MLQHDYWKTTTKNITCVWFLVYFVSASYRYIRCDEIVLLPISLDCRQGVRENFMKGQGVRGRIKVKNHWSSLHSIFPKCMISCVVSFGCRAARVVYDNTHQHCSRCSHPAWNLQVVRPRSWCGKIHFETKKQAQKWEDGSFVHFSVRWNWII